MGWMGGVCAVRVLALLLSLFLSLPTGGVRLTLTAEKSDLLPAGALSGMQSVLSGLALTLSAAGCDVTYGDELLLAARPGALFTADTAASLPMETPPDLDALWEILEPWRTEVGETADLQEAGKARSQAVYVLSAEEWQALGMAGTIAEKATFKRYFDANGQLLGGYFYTAALRLGERLRPVAAEGDLGDDEAREQDRDGALARVAEQREGGRGGAGRAGDVGHADVARADLADVDVLGGGAGDDEARGDAADEEASQGADGGEDGEAH